jgi:DNA primase
MNTEEILKGFSGFKKANRPEVRINCPACGDNTSHLYFNTELNIGNCKKCNYSPNLAKLISDTEGISLDDAYKRIGQGIASKPQVYEEPTVFEYKELQYPPHFVRLDGPDPHHPQRIVDYMLGRGITWETSRNYEMGYCITGEYMWRLIVPIKMFGKLVCWQARDITKTAERRYKNPTGSEFSRYLFNYDRARTFEEGVICEGIFDAIAVGDNGMCTFGKKIGEEQKTLLLKSGIKRLSIMFDADALAEDIKYVKEMAQYIPTRLVMLPTGLDPDEIDKSLLQQLFNWAPYSDEEGFDSYMMRVRLAGSLEAWQKSLVT